MWKSIKINKGKILGGIAGFIVALILIIAWPVILIIFLVFLGILLGAIFDTINKAHKWLQDSLNHWNSNKKDQ